MSVLACRGCGRPGPEVVLSLGKVPLANALLREEDLDAPERRYPLELAFCPRCCLAQITEWVPPEELFEEYPYFSSYSDSAVDAAGELVGRLIEERSLGPDGLALEIASNDGYLLQHYVRAGVPVLGIDPARNVVEVARRRGVPTVCAFFGEDVAEELRRSGRRADVLHANNVLAHVADLDGVARGMARVLADRGVAVVETPYVRDLVDRVEFDTIYHEHRFYFSATALRAVFRRAGLEVTAVERIPAHGGSLRVFAEPAATAAPGPSVEALIEEEAGIGLCRPEHYRGFAERVEGLLHGLREVLSAERSEGRTVAAYGAAAKGTVLLNALEAGPETVAFVADRNPHKQGRYVPGVRVPIVPPERLLEDRPDVVVLLAWNMVSEVVDQQAEYLRRGGRFLVPIPEPRYLP